MDYQTKNNRVEKDTCKPGVSHPTPLDNWFPGLSALVPRRQRALDNGLRKEVVKTIDETFGRD